MAKFVIFGEEKIPVEDNVTADDARAVLERTYPEVRNATYVEDREGNITFQMQAGEKG